jgi:hypothetical protein
MTRLTCTLLGLAALAATPAASAAGLSGNYLITLRGHPNSANGTQYCATLAATGSTENYANSGTVTLQDEEGRSYPGTWFVSHGIALFEIPLPAYSSSPSFIVFSGKLGAPELANATFTEVLNGTPAFDGTFTAVKNGCS